MSCQVLAEFSSLRSSSNSLLTPRSGNSTRIRSSETTWLDSADQLRPGPVIRLLWTTCDPVLLIGTLFRDAPICIFAISSSAPFRDLRPDV